MAADPILLHCSGLGDFLLVVSLGRVRYRVGLRATRLVDTAIDGVSDVRLERVLPWIPWVGGIISFLVGAAYFIGSAAGWLGTGGIQMNMLAPMGLGFALALLVGPRLRLSWTQGGQRHVVLPPTTFARSARNSVNESMRQAYQLLKDPAARLAASKLVLAEHKEAVAVLREAPTGSGSDDRRLCPDGSCVGLLGEDGRCRVCGKS
jgi:hypothetical protein